MRRHTNTKTTHIGNKITAAGLKKLVALKKRIYPADVARLCLFLAADDSAMITGQNLVIDGGRT